MNQTADLFGDPVSGADIDASGRYRYELWRTWNPAAVGILWVMLNPSTADADVDDPTIRRVVRFSKDWGFGWAEIANLYAYRSTDPRRLRLTDDPVGPRNDEVIAGLASSVGEIVVAWGALKTPMRSRAEEVLEILGRSGRPIMCLGHTKDGHPRHPLYVPAKTECIPFGGASA